jgi:TPR repeat protein
MDAFRTILAQLAFPLLIVTAPAPALAAGKLETRLTELSQSGSAEAAYHLGMLYHLGLDGAGKDPRKAFALFKQAAERGDPLGAYKLGCFYDGQGEGVVENDPKLALKYKLIAADAGYSLAQEDVARHLFDLGDMAGGLRWFEAAASQGSTMAALALGATYSGQMPRGFPSQPANPAKSWTYFLIAAREEPKMRSAFEQGARHGLSKDEFARLMAHVAAWRASPTALTKKAAGGVAMAYKAAGLPAPAN